MNKKNEIIKEDFSKGGNRFPNEDELLIWAYGLDCKRYLHRIRNMSRTSKMNPPCIMRNFS